MTLLRTTITGPIMAGVVVAVSLESAALLTNRIPIPGEAFLLSLTISVCTVMTHLAACVTEQIRRHLGDRMDEVEGRIDSYETNVLNTIVGPNAPPHRNASAPTPLRRVR